MTGWSIGAVPHRYVGAPHVDVVASVALIARQWALGLIIHRWGVRLLAGPWHVCIHWPKESK